MPTLENILHKIPIIKIEGKSHKNIAGMTFDSRDVKPGYLFIAKKGTNTDGHKYIEQAIKNGAIAIIYSDKTQKTPHRTDITYVKIEPNNKIISTIASNFFNSPHQKIKIIGVTGTNGKTTIATSLYNLFNLLGIKSGLISTISNYIGEKKIPTNLTTPDTIELNRLFNKMAQNDCQYCFMEVSSHAIEQGRIEGINFNGGIFTNLTHDHLDYHKTFKNYLTAKKRFFDNLPGTAFALTNIDDKNGNIIVQNTTKKYTYALKTIADFKAKIIEQQLEATHISIGDKDLWINFAGKFNVYNLLAVYATATLLLPASKAEILRVLTLLEPIVGRFDIIKSNNKYAIIDYAHTPDALENTLKELKNIKTDRQKIITVVGAGGNRDKNKRPKMAAIAHSLSDTLILTSDNPRTEDPEKILDDMQSGIIKSDDFLRITDRKQAIKTAVKIANANDIILIAGKGHETYQEIDGKKHHFDDKNEIQKLLTIN